MVLVTMDHFQHLAASLDGGSGGPELPAPLLADRAHEPMGQVARVGAAALFAIGPIDESSLFPAGRANEPFPGRRCAGLAELANLGVD